jgi:dCMP deaminase
MKRISIDQYFMELAAVVSKRSVCLKHYVGCLIAVDNRLRVTGYNGPARGCAHCDICVTTESGQCAFGIHAEQNAVADAAQTGTSVKDGTAYITLEPCLSCTKLLIAAGIRRIVYCESFGDNGAAIFANMCGVPFEKFGAL